MVLADVSASFFAVKLVQKGPKVQLFGGGGGAIFQLERRRKQVVIDPLVARMIVVLQFRKQNNPIPIEPLTSLKQQELKL